MRVSDFRRPYSLKQEELIVKRSIGVTVIAILALLGSVFTLLMGVLMAWVMFRLPETSQSPFPGSPIFFKLMMFMAVLMYLLPAIWGICTSIGLFRLKNWARLSIIVFAVLLILMSGFGMLMSMVVPIPSPPTGPPDKSIETGVRIFMGMFSSALVGLGVWWVVFFNRRKVREQFVSPQLEPAIGALPQASPQITGTIAATPRIRQRPLSITILAWFLLVGCLFIPVNVLLRAPAVFFTKLLTGYPATLYFLAFAALQLYIGIGLLRLKPAARIVCIWYLAFGFVNASVFYLAPGAHARMLALIEKQQSMFPWMRPWQNQAWLQTDLTPLLVIGGCVGLAVLILPVYFLITRKQAFEKATIVTAV
jgi:hypothetical protein